MKINKQTILGAAMGAITVATLGIGAVSFAATDAVVSPLTHMGHGVVGEVTAVSGNTITVTGKNGTTYSIDASAATITKNMTVSVGDIKVGDTVMAQGTVAGASVAATTIHDGLPPMGMHEGMMGHGWGKGGKKQASTTK